MTKTSAERGLDSFWSFSYRGSGSRFCYKLFVLGKVAGRAFSSRSLRCCRTARRGLLFGAASGISAGAGGVPFHFPDAESFIEHCDFLEAIGNQLFGEASGFRMRT